MQLHYGSCDGEGFLATVQSWATKASKDSIPGMVDLLQKVLQVFAAESLSRALPAEEHRSPSEKLYAQLLAADTGNWTAMLLIALVGSLRCIMPYICTHTGLRDTHQYSCLCLCLHCCMYDCDTG